MRLLVLLYSFFAETTSKILHFWPRGGVYFANGCKNAPAAAKSRARAFVFHNITLGNTAQFPPCGLSTAPAAAARHLR
ncbi:hypothetical protein L3K78_12840, partial [Oscillospiraceae bacterium SCCA1]|nr:hypothetical protein [Oscillospiraceae bacterium SCCA1]